MAASAVDRFWLVFTKGMHRSPRSRAEVRMGFCRPTGLGRCRGRPREAIRAASDAPLGLLVHGREATARRRAGREGCGQNVKRSPEGGQENLSQALFRGVLGRQNSIRIWRVDMLSCLGQPNRLIPCSGHGCHASGLVSGPLTSWRSPQMVVRWQRTSWWCYWAWRSKGYSSPGASGRPQRAPRSDPTPGQKEPARQLIVSTLHVRMEYWRPTRSRSICWMTVAMACACPTCPA
jgi:hypothetical protein